MRLDCKVCAGRRYRDDVLKLTWHGRSIHDVLEMTVADARGYFASVEEPRKRSAGIRRGLQLLIDVGVGYLRLGQSLTTLSGGEAQRLKLAWANRLFDCESPDQAAAFGASNTAVTSAANPSRSRDPAESPAANVPCST